MGCPSLESEASLALMQSSSDRLVGFSMAGSSFSLQTLKVLEDLEGFRGTNPECFRHFCSEKKPKISLNV